MAKSLIYKNLILNEDEDIAKLIRQPIIILIAFLIIPITLVSSAFFFLYPLFSWGNKGIAIFTALIIIGLFWLIRNIVVWYWKVFIVTSQRIIDFDQKGIFQKIVSDIPLTKIQDVFYQIKGFGQTLTRIGNVNIILADNKTKIEIRNIHQPRKIQQLILQLKADTLKDKMVSMVKKIKAGIGEEKFNQILNESDDSQVEER